MTRDSLTVTSSRAISVTGRAAAAPAGTRPAGAGIIACRCIAVIAGGGVVGIGACAAVAGIIRTSIAVVAI